MTGFIFGWTTPLWERFIFFITSCHLLSSLMQYSTNNTHWPSACRNGITCIRFCQILPFSVQIPPLLLYFVFVCSVRYQGCCVVFSPCMCFYCWCRNSMVPQILHGAASWCFVLILSWLAFCFRFSSATFTLQLRDFCPRSVVWWKIMFSSSIWDTYIYGNLSRKYAVWFMQFFNFHYWSKVWGQ